MPLSNERISCIGLEIVSHYNRAVYVWRVRVRQSSCGRICMISTDRKENADQRGKNLEEIAPAGKAIWHRPAVRRLETAPWTRFSPYPGDDLVGAGMPPIPS